MVSPERQTETTMTNLNSAITDGDLDQVSGGMDCRTAVGLATVYLSLARIFAAGGDLVNGAYYAGKAGGVTEGAGCGK
jgi:hypothetical protein